MKDRKSHMVGYQKTDISTKIFVMSLEHQELIPLNFRKLQNFDLESIPEAATRGILWKKVFLEILQNSPGNTCVRASFLRKLQASGIFIKKGTLERCFPVNFAQFFRTPILKNTSGRLHSLLFCSLQPHFKISVDLVTFTENILNGKLHFLCSVARPTSTG